MSVRALPSVDGRIGPVRQMLEMPLSNGKAGLSDDVHSAAGQFLFGSERSCHFKELCLGEFTLHHSAYMVRGDEQLPAQRTPSSLRVPSAASTSTVSWAGQS